MNYDWTANLPISFYYAVISFDLAFDFDFKCTNGVEEQIKHIKDTSGKAIFRGADPVFLHMHLYILKETGLQCEYIGSQIIFKVKNL